MKWLKKTLFSIETSNKEDKQVNPIEAHEEDNPTNSKKSQPLRLNNNKKNPTTNNVVQKCNVPIKKGSKSLNKIQKHVVYNIKCENNNKLYTRQSINPYKQFKQCMRRPPKKMKHDIDVKQNNQSNIQVGYFVFKYA